MRTIDKSPKRSFSVAFVCRLLAALAFGVLSLVYVEGQNTPDKASSSGPGTFAIETEMLTYRALESNSEAIACDIAAYLNGVSANFAKPPEGSICDVKAGARKAMVILLAFDNREFGDFQIWRADMESMDRLQRKAEVDCPRQTTRGAAAPSATSAAGTFLSMSPAGPPLALAQSVLALMASEEAVSSVGGTIQDQAFMNGIGRELRALGVPVLMPMAYSPFALTPLDRAKSPFLASLDRTLAARECLSGLVSANDEAKKTRVKQTLSDLDDFLAVLMETAVPPTKSGASNAESTPPSTSASGAAAGKPTAKQSSAGTVALPSPSHLNAVLSADGLAQKLGVDPDTGAFQEGGPSQHILLVKALESGGTVTRRSNVLGATVRYSGGSVGTYALFTAGGDLECAGNVYDYAGSVTSKKFQGDLRKYRPEPGKQVIFERGGCRTSAAPR